MDQVVDTTEAAKAVEAEFLKIKSKDSEFSSNVNSSALPTRQHFSTSSTNPNSSSSTDQNSRLIVQTLGGLAAQAQKPGRRSGSSRSESTRTRQKHKTTMSARDCIAKFVSKFVCPAILVLGGLVAMMYWLQIPCIFVLTAFVTFVVVRAPPPGPFILDQALITAPDAPHYGLPHGLLPAP